jgi:DNA-binding transcriptional regulator YbjK
MLIDRHYYGCYETVEQFCKVQELWKQAITDRENGVDSSDSEAAERLRQRYKQYHRKTDAKPLFAIWD